MVFATLVMIESLSDARLHASRAHKVDTTPVHVLCVDNTAAFGTNKQKRLLPLLLSSPTKLDDVAGSAAE